MFVENISSKRKRSRTIETKKMSSNFKILLIIILVIIITIALSYIYIINQDSDVVIGNPIARFDTSLGEFEIELFRDKVPKTCENFVKLVDDEFYNGMIFYRISDNFMIQAGRHLYDGSEKFTPYGNIEFETHPDVLHIDGAISMASTSPGVGGSAEFFICDGVQSFLDNNYAAFGVVVEGIDIVREIASQPHDGSNPAGGGKPYTDIIINSITIE